MMLDWLDPTAPPLPLPFALAGLGNVHLENNAPVAKRWLTDADVPFIYVSSWPDSEQRYEPGAHFRANHHRGVDGALDHPTCP